MIMSSNAGAWLRRYESAESSSVSLVCFPHAGGSASFFVGMSRALAPVVDVVAIQYPGRQDRIREPALDSISALADQIYGQLAEADLPRLAFFGHSMGATVAFEVARRLEAAQRDTPVRLFASGRRAPSIMTASAVHLLCEAEFIAELSRLSGDDLPFTDDDELLRAALPALRADYKAIETYKYAPDARLSCPISAFVGEHDPITSVEQASAWQHHTRNHFDICIFPGGHFYLAAQRERLFHEVRLRISPPGGG
jgi:surfactin synthase thioesterase subunit